MKILSIFIGYLIHLVYCLDTTPSVPSEKILSEPLELLEGIGVVYQFHKGQTAQLTYKQEVPWERNQEFLFVSLNLLDSQTANLPRLSFQPSVKMCDSEEPIKLITQSISKSNVEFSVSIPRMKGKYQILITSDQTFTANLMISQHQITYLRPYNNVPTSEDHTFSIYSKNAAVVQIFACTGEVSVEGSTILSDLESSQTQHGNKVSLKTPNYGGHFLIDTGNISGNYFVKVNKKNENSSYMITHNYYDEQDVVPYKFVHLPNPFVSYKFINGTILFSINPVTIDNSSSIEYNLVEYRLFISIGRDLMMKFVACRDKYVYLIRNTSNDGVHDVEFSIEKSSLIEDVVNSGIQIFYITAEARIYLDPVEEARKDLHYPPQFRMIYDVNQIKSKELMKDEDNSTGKVQVPQENLQGKLEGNPEQLIEKSAEKPEEKPTEKPEEKLQGQSEGYSNLVISLFVVIMAAVAIYFIKYRHQDNGLTLDNEEHDFKNQGQQSLA